MRIILAAMMLLALFGCAARPAPPDPVVPVQLQPVKEAVPVRCAPNIGPEPDYPDTDAALKAAPNLFERVKLLLAGRLLRIQRDQEKTAALDGCRNG